MKTLQHMLLSALVVMAALAGGCNHSQEVAAPTADRDAPRAEPVADVDVYADGYQFKDGRFVDVVAEDPVLAAIADVAASFDFGDGAVVWLRLHHVNVGSFGYVMVDASVAARTRLPGPEAAKGGGGVLRCNCWLGDEDYLYTYSTSSQCCHVYRVCESSHGCRPADLALAGLVGIWEMDVNCSPIPTPAPVPACPNPFN